VADASTGLLMQQLYRLREQDKLTKAEALRQAQLALMSGAVKPTGEDSARGAKAMTASAQPKVTAYPSDPDKPYAHPYYWAPFILMGNWL
jgi:CHAT domain-containing protein